MKLDEMNIPKQTNPNRTFASFILIGKNLDPLEVTTSIKITANKSFKRGDLRTETEKWQHGYWELCSSNTIESTDLELHIQWIVDQIFPIRHKLPALLKAGDIKAEISCFSILTKGQTVVTLTSKLLNQLADINIKIEFDLYSDE